MNELRFKLSILINEKSLVQLYERGIVQEYYSTSLERELPNFVRNIFVIMMENQIAN